MKKILLCGALATLCLSSTAQGKINNAGMLQIDQFNYTRSELAKTSASRAAALTQDVNAIVTLADGYSADDLRELGVKVIDTTANMAIVTVAIDQVEALAENACVKLIDFGYQAEPLNDAARALSFADACHAGSDGLSHPYKGNGVLVGLYDTGLDPNHVAFTDANGKSRVEAVYLVNSGNVSPYTTAEQIALFETDTRYESHGTHVLGTIAGREGVQGTFGYKNNAANDAKDGAIPFYGVAPEATILVGCGSFDNISINAGIGKVIDRAKDLGKPVVVNLSLGHNRGSHDPRETVNQYLDSRADDAIICVAAGNEGGSQMSFEKTFTNTNPVRTSMVPQGSNPKAFIWYTAEFWSDKETPYTADIVLFNKTTKKAILTYTVNTKSGSMSWDTSDTTFGAQFENGSRVSARWGVDGSTGRFNISMENKTTAKTGDVVVGISINSQTGTRINGYCDAYNGYSADEVRFANATGWPYSVTGSDIGSINGMACGYNTISVGAYVSKNSVPNISKTAYNYDAGTGVGSLAKFSSYGVSGDGRQLPIVCAPGAQIVSSVSRYWVKEANITDGALSAKATVGNKTYPYYYMQGTSMATPFVTGSVALWLEACPQLRGSHVQEIIAATSTPAGTSTDAKRWGAGKINVLAGLKKAIEMNASIDGVWADKADENLMVNALGGKQFEVSVLGTNNLTCALHNLQGAQVLSADSADDTLTLDASALQQGIYMLTVNAGGQKLSRKLVVK